MEKKKSEMNILIRILSYIFSFLIPVIGTGMWLFYRKADRKQSRIYLILSIAGFIANYVFVTYLENVTGIKVG